MDNRHPDDVQITDNPDQQRFEIRVGGQLAGFAHYRLGDGVIVFDHTEVFERFGGQGYAGRLAKAAMQQVDARGDRTVVAVCPFIKKWLTKHPAYQHLVRS